MKQRLASKFFASLTHLRRRLCSVQVVSCRCISSFKSGRAIFTDTFLDSAEELRLELLIRSPLLRWRIRPSPHICIAPDPSAGFLHNWIVTDLRVRQLGRGVTRLSATLPRRSWLNRKSLHIE